MFVAVYQLRWLQASVLAVEAWHQPGFIDRDTKPGVRISLTPPNMATEPLLDLELPVILHLSRAAPVSVRFHQELRHDTLTP